MLSRTRLPTAEKTGHRVDEFETCSSVEEHISNTRKERDFKNFREFKMQNIYTCTNIYLCKSIRSSTTIVTNRTVIKIGAKVEAAKCAIGRLQKSDCTFQHS